MTRSVPDEADTIVFGATGGDLAGSHRGGDAQPAPVPQPTLALASSNHAAPAGSAFASSAPVSAALPTWSNAQIADYLRQGYWDGIGESPRSFNLGSTGSGANAGVLRYSFEGVNAAGVALAERALKLYGEVLDVQFTRTASTAAGIDLYFTNDTPDSAYTWTETYAGAPQTIRASHVNVGSGWVNDYGAGTATYSFQTYVHEIGHALGLGHAGDYNGAAKYVTSTDDPDFGNNTNVYLNDSWQASIMSYFSQIDNTRVNADYAFNLSPMVADWIALGEIYGGAGGFAGDTTWGFNTSITSTVFANLASYADEMTFTIIDEGGRDSVDFSGFSAAQTIDLNPQKFSSVGGLVGNMSIAVGTVIENARGGAGGDTITGNSAANTLSGLGGADILRGGGGADTLVGGAGSDTLIGGSGSDVFRLTTTSDSTLGAPDVLRAGNGGAAFDGPGVAPGDRIDVSAIDANQLVGGHQSFVFGGTARGHLWTTSDGSDTVVNGNVDGDAAADFQLRIEDGATLASAYTAADFIL